MLIDQELRRPGEGLTGSTTGISRPTVVVADDDAGVGRMIAAILGRDFQVETAEDGLHAIDLVRALHPPLVILDEIMPGLNGSEVCRRIKAYPPTSRTSVLILTVFPSDEAITRASEVGAEAYFPKPFSIAEFRQAVNRLVGRALPAQAA